MIKDIKIKDEVVKPGEVKYLDFFVSRLPTGTNINMPITVGRSKKDGPTLLLIGGMHGDEINGVEILRRIIKNKLFIPDRGSVICIPILNTLGFINFSRENSGGKDVNRSFPGSTTGSLASQIAHFMAKEIIPQIDCAIDFHTGGKRINNYPQIRTVFDHEASYQLAQSFSAPFMLNSPLRDKSLRKFGHSLGKPILVYEAGESLRLRQHSIVTGVNGTLRVMRFLNMIDSAPEPKHQSEILNKSTWLRAKRSGMYYSVVRSGAPISKNETLGYIADPYGQKETKVTSPLDGFVIAVNNNPIINRGDALIHLGLND